MVEIAVGKYANAISRFLIFALGKLVGVDILIEFIYLVAVVELQVVAPVICGIGGSVSQHTVLVGLAEIFALDFAACIDIIYRDISQGGTAHVVGCKYGICGAAINVDRQEGGAKYFFNVGICLHLAVEHGYEGIIAGLVDLEFESLLAVGTCCGHGLRCQARKHRHSFLGRETVAAGTELVEAEADRFGEGIAHLDLEFCPGINHI